MYNAVTGKIVVEKKAYGKALTAFNFVVSRLVLWRCCVPHISTVCVDGFD